MPEYIALDPHAEVKGAAVLATLGGINPEQVRPIAEKFGLIDIRADEWYPQQAWLDTLRVLEQDHAGGTLNLVSVGMEIPRTADWPSEIKSFEAALRSIDEAYYMNHRHGEIGHYKAERIDDRQVDVICDNPYPCRLDYGIIYGVARMFGKKEDFNIEHDENSCRRKGDTACIYHVTWQRR